MKEKIKPMGQRLFVKDVQEDKYVETASGIILEKPEVTSKQKFVKVEIVEVGKQCEMFTEEAKGMTVLIHEFAGATLDGINNDIRIVHETDVQGYVEN